jgi:thioredoxin-related protein
MKIDWMTIEEAEQANKKEPRKIFVDVYTNWCGWCKKMDKTTFSDSLVQKYGKEKFYFVKLSIKILGLFANSTTEVLTKTLVSFIMKLTALSHFYPCLQLR